MSLDYQKYYEDGWKNKPDRSTPVVAEALNNIDDAIIETQEAIKGIGGKNVASAKMATGQITDAFDGSAIVTDFETEGKEIPASGFDVRFCNENFMPFPYYHENGKQLNGITWTYDENGVLYANGTASSNSAFLIADDSQKVVIPKGSYKMTGCPSGGSGSTYRMRLYVAEATSQYAVGQTFTDSGNGAEFEFTEDTICRIYPQVMSGYNAQNLTFKPMILKEDSESEYVPPKSKTVHVDSNAEIPVLGNIRRCNKCDFTF